MKCSSFSWLLLSLGIASCSPMHAQKPDQQSKTTKSTMHAYEAKAVATFAGGCFWCMEPPFEDLPGVHSVISGYTGGPEKDPSYKEVASGITGHTEAIQVHFDPTFIGYDQLLQVYWKSMDPTDIGGQFADRGSQYRPEIFVHNDYQKKIAKESKQQLATTKRFQKPIIVPITDFVQFYRAEEYHQDYYNKKPFHYKTYRKGSGRTGFLQRVWGDDLNKLPTRSYRKPTDEIIRKQLSQAAYNITQEDGTERAFSGKYWNNKKPGIYVDIVTGEPLFSSQDKFRSGTGWPSFTKPLVTANVIEKKDTTLGVTRTEVRSKHGDSHLGHVFPDGPAPTGLRYCINSASLRFIAADSLDKMGYGHFSGNFQGK